MKKLLIWGAGDQGTVTLDCALATKQYNQIDFLDFKEKGHREIPGYTIYQEGKEDLTCFIKQYDEVIIASGDNMLRKEKIEFLSSLPVLLATIIHPSAIISPLASIGKGNTILANTIINCNASIGIGCIINNGSIIEHDCVVEDFVNICPKVAMAGHTEIGTMSFLGIGSTMIDDVKVGSNVIVGAGTVIVKDIPNNVTVVGVPAKIIKS